MFSSSISHTFTSTWRVILFIDCYTIDEWVFNWNFDYILNNVSYVHSNMNDSQDQHTYYMNKLWYVTRVSHDNNWIIIFNIVSKSNYLSISFISVNKPLANYLWNLATCLSASTKYSYFCCMMNIKYWHWNTTLIWVFES